MESVTLVVGCAGDGDGDENASDSKGSKYFAINAFV